MEWWWTTNQDLEIWNSATGKKVTTSSSTLYVWISSGLTNCVKLIFFRVKAVRSPFSFVSVWVPVLFHINCCQLIPTSWKRLGAKCHWLPTSQDVMAALNPMTFGWSSCRRIWWNTCSVCCQRCTRTAALMALVELTTESWRRVTCIIARKHNAGCHTPAFSQQLIRALQVTTSGTHVPWCISSNQEACCHRPCCSQELMTALNVKMLGSTVPWLEFPNKKSSWTSKLSTHSCPPQPT